MATLATRPTAARRPESTTRPVLVPRLLLLFDLGGQAYGIPVKDVQEIVPMAQLARSPRLPAMLAGFLNLAGKAIPVPRLDSLLGLPELSVGLHTPLIVLRLSDGCLALMVEQVHRLVSVPEDALTAVPEKHSINDCVEGVVTIAGRTFLVLAADRTLFEKEQQCLAELQDREQTRLRELEDSIP